MPLDLIHENTMSIESTADWEGLRQVANVARVTLDVLAEEVQPGVTTGELDATAAQLFADQGARSAPALVYGFPGTVLISINDQIVHGIPGARRIREGDIVKIDVTVEKDGVRCRCRAQRCGRASQRHGASIGRLRGQRVSSWLGRGAGGCSGQRDRASGSNARCVAEDSRSSKVSQSTGSVERFMKSPPSRIATTRGNRTC
jgi:hypothetical protein